MGPETRLALKSILSPACSFPQPSLRVVFAVSNLEGENHVSLQGKEVCHKIGTFSKLRVPRLQWNPSTQSIHEGPLKLTPWDLRTLEN